MPRRSTKPLTLREFSEPRACTSKHDLSSPPPASSATSPATKKERYPDEMPVAVTSTAEAAVSIRRRCRCGQSESRYPDDTEDLCPDTAKSIGEDNRHHRQPTNHDCSDSRANVPCHGSYLVTDASYLVQLCKFDADSLEAVPT